MTDLLDKIANANFTTPVNETLLTHDSEELALDESKLTIKATKVENDNLNTASNKTNKTNKTNTDDQKGEVQIETVVANKTNN